MSESPSLHTLRVPRTARVATLGALDATASWWVVLHGYGQLSADFIEAFAPIVTPNRCVIATADPHMPPARRDAVRRQLLAPDVPVTVRTFDDGHRMDPDTSGRHSRDALQRTMDKRTGTRLRTDVHAADTPPSSRYPIFSIRSTASRARTRTSSSISI